MSSTPAPSLVNPSDPEMTPPRARIPPGLSTVTDAAVEPNAIGRFTDELPVA